MNVPWSFGKSPTELGYPLRNIMIYRALPKKNPVLKKGDYLTLSLKFAKGHAQHMAITEEEDQIVVSAFLPAEDVIGARNPGEYRYNGRGEFRKVVPLYLAIPPLGDLSRIRRASSERVASQYLKAPNP